MVRVHLLISGLVQGVCFRAETKYRAQELGLCGWVKNSPDAKVEAVFEGDRPSVEKMIQWCTKGPAGAIVHNVTVEWQGYQGEYKDFYIK
jgi:acylphosphatase